VEQDQGTPPLKPFYEGYIVSASLDAAIRSLASKPWELIEIEEWRDTDAHRLPQLCCALNTAGICSSLEGR
jgi:hypothetical protein